MGEIGTTASTRRTRRARVAAGALAVGLVVLVGCASTIDGRAAIGDEQPTSSSTSSTSRSSESTSASSTTSGSDESTTADTGSSSADPTTSPDDPATSTTGQTTSETTTSPDDPDDPDDPDADTTFTGNPDNLALTAPGAQLAFGAAALLPFSYADADGVFSVNGLTVTKGSEADWATLGVDTSDAQGEEPWYLRMTLKQESGGDFAYTSVQDDLWAYGPDDDLVATVYPDDDANSLCPLTYAPEGFAVGQSYDACIVLSVNLGETVDHVQFEGGYDPADPYYENPVVWEG